MWDCFTDPGGSAVHSRPSPHPSTSPSRPPVVWGISCRGLHGDCLLKGREWKQQGRGDAGTWEPLENPPICTSWNNCRRGTTHFIGVQQRADTTVSSVACTELTISGDKYTERTAEAEAFNQMMWSSRRAVLLFVSCCTFNHCDTAAGLCMKGRD